MASSLPVLTLKAGTGTLQLEVAQTPGQQRDGLMFRRSLGQNAGMLFPVDPPEPLSMWMKNTFIDLDAIFVDSCGRILRIAHMKANTETMHFSWGSAAFVIETNPGWAQKHGLKEGDTIASLVSAPCGQSR